MRLKVARSATAYLSKTIIKPFVPQRKRDFIRQIVSSDITQELSCIVDNVGSRF